MQVATVTTSDRSLLGAVRGTLATAEDAFLCVAFVQEKGVHLVEKELEALRKRRGRARLLVTTTFQTTSAPALGMAARLGLEVRVLNPGSGSTFHPKLYLGRNGARARAVIGSANLTGGLATNLEAAVALDGERKDEPLSRAWEWVESLWTDTRVHAWYPGNGVAEPAGEELDPELYAAIRAEWLRNPLFHTLGPHRRRNLVTDVTPSVVYVETARSRSERGGAAEIPAWMFNLAWDQLRTHGILTNRTLLKDFRVHRSSAVCAILARLPGVDADAGRYITLRWKGREVA
ncbi:phospholipase D family protein [Anaeromyxobacter soli]|uniref:phospholipase D family protein n=1 Tax=Anaeromyxobacter soli TaxID=2922725 RepID=UPI001FAFAA21|nr:phospholipase D family protein [Anaeromyxobacter sp. SG29]